MLNELKQTMGRELKEVRKTLNEQNQNLNRQNFKKEPDKFWSW